MADQIGELGLDVSQFEKALATVDVEMADLLIESKKLNAEIKLLERNMYLAGGGTKAQAKELKQLTSVSEDFAEQMKRGKLEQKAFSEAAGGSSENVGKLGGVMKKLDSVFASLVGISFLHTLATGFKAATEEAIELQRAIDKISTPNVGFKFISDSDLQSQLKGIETLRTKIEDTKSVLEGGIEDHFPEAHKEIYKEQIAERKKQLDDLDNKQKQIDGQLAKRQDARNKITALENNHQHEEAAIAKNTADFNVKIAEAVEKRLFKYAKELKQLRDITEQQIKINFENERRKVTSSIADDEARVAIQNELNDAKNKQIVKDQDADKKQREADMWTDAERGTEADRRRKELEDDKKWEDAERGTEADRRRKDANDEIARARLLRKDTEDFNNEVKEANDQFAADKKKIEDEGEKILYQNKELTKELHNQLKIQELLRKGDVAGAKRESMEQDFEDRIRDARREKNQASVDILEKQREESRRQSDRDEANKTPRQRANERKGRRAAQREIDNGARRVKDLDDKIARGVRGDSDSEIENRRADRASRAGHDKQSLIPAEQKGYTTTDRALLQQIRDNLTNKDG